MEEQLLQRRYLESLKKWKRQFQEITHSKDPKNLNECIIKFIEYVINYTSGNSWRNQTLICRYSFALWEELIDEDFVDTFVKYATKTIFDIVIEEGKQTWCIKKEILKIFNHYVANSSKAIKCKTVSELSDIYLMKIIDSISSYGDYDLQAVVIETIFRMYGRAVINARLKDLIPESQELSQCFAEINPNTFDEDVRPFLNNVNKKSGKIFSIICKKVQVGDMICLPPTENVDGIWVDFNVWDSAITWYCSKSSFAESQNERDDMWNLITLFISDVETVNIHSPADKSSFIIHCDLTSSCLSNFEDNQTILDQAKSLSLLLGSSEDTDRLINDVLPALLGNKLKRPSESKIKRQKVSNANPGYKPLKISVNRKTKSLTSSSKLNSSINTSIFDPISMKSTSKSDDRSLDNSKSATSGAITIDSPSSHLSKDSKLSELENDDFETLPKIQILSRKCSGYSHSPRNLFVDTPKKKVSTGVIAVQHYQEVKHEVRGVAKPIDSSFDIEEEISSETYETAEDVAPARRKISRYEGDIEICESIQNSARAKQKVSRHKTDLISSEVYETAQDFPKSSESFNSTELDSQKTYVLNVTRNELNASKKWSKNLESPAMTEDFSSLEVNIFQNKFNTTKVSYAPGCARKEAKSPKKKNQHVGTEIMVADTTSPEVKSPGFEEKIILTGDIILDQPSESQWSNIKPQSRERNELSNSFNSNEFDSMKVNISRYVKDKEEKRHGSDILEENVISPLLNRNKQEVAKENIEPCNKKLNINANEANMDIPSSLTKEDINLEEKRTILMSKDLGKKNKKTHEKDTRINEHYKKTKLVPEDNIKSMKLRGRSKKTILMKKKNINMNQSEEISKVVLEVTESGNKDLNKISEEEPTMKKSKRKSIPKKMKEHKNANINHTVGISNDEVLRNKDFNNIIEEEPQIIGNRKHRGRAKKENKASDINHTDQKSKSANKDYNNVVEDEAKIKEKRTRTDKHEKVIMKENKQDNMNHSEETYKIVKFTTDDKEPGKIIEEKIKIKQNRKQSRPIKKQSKETVTNCIEIFSEEEETPDYHKVSELERKMEEAIRQKGKPEKTIMKENEKADIKHDAEISKEIVRFISGYEESGNITLEKEKNTRAEHITHEENKLAEFIDHDIDKRSLKAVIEDKETAENIVREEINESNLKSSAVVKNLNLSDNETSETKLKPYIEDNTQHMKQREQKNTEVITRIFSDDGEINTANQIENKLARDKCKRPATAAVLNRIETYKEELMVEHNIESITKNIENNDKILVVELQRLIYPYTSNHSEMNVENNNLVQEIDVMDKNESNSQDENCDDNNNEGDYSGKIHIEADPLSPKVIIDPEVAFDTLFGRRKGHISRDIIPSSDEIVKDVSYTSNSSRTKQTIESNQTKLRKNVRKCKQSFDIIELMRENTDNFDMSQIQKTEFEHSVGPEKNQDTDLPIDVLSYDVVEPVEKITDSIVLGNTADEPKNIELTNTVVDILSSPDMLKTVKEVANAIGQKNIEYRTKTNEHSDLVIDVLSPDVLKPVEEMKDSIRLRNIEDESKKIRQSNVVEEIEQPVEASVDLIEMNKINHLINDRNKSVPRSERKRVTFDSILPEQVANIIDNADANQSTSTTPSVRKTRKLYDPNDFLENISLLQNESLQHKDKKQMFGIHDEKPEPKSVILSPEKTEILNPSLNQAVVRKTDPKVVTPMLKNEKKSKRKLLKGEISYKDIKREQMQQQNHREIIRKRRCSDPNVHRKHSRYGHKYSFFDDMVDSYREELGVESLLEKLKKNEHKDSSSKKRTSSEKKKKTVDKKKVRTLKHRNSEKSKRPHTIKVVQKSKTLPLLQSSSSSSPSPAKKLKIDEALIDSNILPTSPIQIVEKSKSEHKFTNDKKTVNMLSNVLINPVATDDGVQPIERTRIEHQSFIPDALQDYAKDKHVLQNHVHPSLGPKVPNPAPCWEGTAVYNDAFIHLKFTDYLGKYLVFLFYPLDFTLASPPEISAFSGRINEFRRINTEVLACSVDSHFTHLAWMNTPAKEGGLEKINFPLLSDLSHKISKDFGVFMEDRGHTLRALFIIDCKGIVRQITMNDLAVGSSVDETLRLVNAFQYADKHGSLLS